MSKVGFYRLKFKPTSDGTATKNIYINNVVKAITVKVYEHCPDGLLIKYIDRNGQIRHLSFDKNYKSETRSTSLGKTSDFVANILTASTNQRNVGFDSTKEITVSKDVELTRLWLYEMLSISPKIYMLLSSGEWQEIIIQPGTFTNKPNKGNIVKVSFTFELPKQYNIGLL